MKTLGSLKGSDIEFQIANIKTWISAAITDEDTCTEGFEERNITDGSDDQDQEEYIFIDCL